jgi:hypothetical protein
MPQGVNKKIVGLISVSCKETEKVNTSESGGWLPEQLQ